MSFKLKDLPWDDIQAHLDDLAVVGVTQEQALAAIGAALDAAFPAALVIPGPAGLVAEALDGPLITCALKLAWAFAQSPSGRARRAAHRAARAARAAEREGKP